MHLHSVFLSFFLLLSLFLSDALALSRSFSFFLCLSFGVSFLLTQRDTSNPFLNGGMGTERYVTKCGMRISRILLIRSTVSFDVWKTYINSNTNPLTLSQVCPPSNKCHINTLFLRVRYKIEKMPESRANTFYNASWHCYYAPKKFRMRHCAAVPGLRQGPSPSARLPHFFLSFWVVKTQPNHWTERVVSTQLIAGAPATERFGAQLPGAHWSGPEQCGCVIGQCFAPMYKGQYTPL